MQDWSSYIFVGVFGLWCLGSFALVGRAFFRRRQRGIGDDQNLRD